MFGRQTASYKELLRTKRQDSSASAVLIWTVFKTLSFPFYGCFSTHQFCFTLNHVYWCFIDVLIQLKTVPFRSMWNILQCCIILKGICSCLLRIHQIHHMFYLCTFCTIAFTSGQNNSLGKMRGCSVIGIATTIPFRRVCTTAVSCTERWRIVGAI